MGGNRARSFEAATATLPRGCALSPRGGCALSPKGGGCVVLALSHPPPHDLTRTLVFAHVHLPPFSLSFSFPMTCSSAGARAGGDRPRLSPSVRPDCVVFRQMKRMDSEWSGRTDARTAMCVVASPLPCPSSSPARPRRESKHFFILP